LDRRKKVFLALVVFLLAVTGGSLVGYLIHVKRQSLQTNHLLNAGRTIHVLTLGGIFSAEFLSGFERASGVRVSLTEFARPESLWAEFDKPGSSAKYDLVTLVSYQIPQAVQLLRLKDLNESNLDLSQAHDDFRDIPGDSGRRRVLPLLWGASGLVYNVKNLKSEPHSWHEIFANHELKGKVVLLGSPAHLAHLEKSLAASAGSSAATDSRDEGVQGKDVDDESEVAESEVAPETTAVEGAENGADTPETDALLRRKYQTILQAARFSKTFLSSLSWTKSDVSEGQSPPHAVPEVVEMNAGESSFTKDADWKFVLPQEKAPLWILTLAMVQGTQVEGDAYKFMRALTTVEGAKALSIESHQASTCRCLEQSSLDPRLKPSYLRSIPLTRMQMLVDFQTSQRLNSRLKNSAGFVFLPETISDVNKDANKDPVKEPTSN
jgi:spermidine/putrescine-binding protein